MSELFCEGPHGKSKPKARFALRVLDSGTPETEYYYCQKCFENQEYWAIVDEDNYILKGFLEKALPPMDKEKVNEMSCIAQNDKGKYGWGWVCACCGRHYGVESVEK